MTQALVNNLNIINNKSVIKADKLPKTEGLDFGKIFETKTNSEEQNDITAKQEPVDTAENSLNQTQIIQNDNNILTETTNMPADTSQLLQDDTEQVLQAFVEVGNSLITNVIANTTEEDAENTITEEIIKEESNIEENPEEESNIEENPEEELTITENEVPTMYNELNTLEDPTAVLILQSQIQKTIKTTLETDENKTENNSVILKSNDKQQCSDLTGATVFKQFDKQVSKDASLVNFAPRENSHQKTDGRGVSSVINENIVKELNVEVISSQLADAEGSMSDLMQNQSPQEQAARVMIQGDIKYEAIEQETVKSAVQLKTTDITPSKIVEQISKQLEGMFNNSKLNMVLNPGTLGKVNLQLINTKDGLTAQFTVTTQEAKDLLMKGFDGLKESLLAQGVSIDSLSIKLEEADNENLFDWTEQEGSKGGYKQQQTKKQKENEQSFEKMMFDIENEENV